MNILIVGKPLARNTTHIIVSLKTYSFCSQHRSEKAAVRELKALRSAGSYGAMEKEVLPVAEALAAYAREQTA